MVAFDRLFGDLSLPENAYALGVVAGVGRVERDVLVIPLRDSDAVLLDLVRAKTSSDIPTFYECRDGVVRVFAPFGALAAGFLGAPPGDRDRMRFPELPAGLEESFVRGLFDAVGKVSNPKGTELVVRLRGLAPGLVAGLRRFARLEPNAASGGVLELSGVVALDFLGRLYESVALAPGGALLARGRHLRRYRRWCQKVLGVSEAPELGRILVQRTRPDAVLPSKERVSDSGYDLTLLYEAKRHGGVVLYGTGLVVEPPAGWYFDVVPRSSIVKRGYLLANSVGIIDRSYRGEILVPLWKADPSAPELELPARVAQLIPRPIVHFPVDAVESLSRTERGSGGFGSTG